MLHPKIFLPLAVPALLLLGACSNSKDSSGGPVSSAGAGGGAGGQMAQGGQAGSPAAGTGGLGASGMGGTAGMATGGSATDAGLDASAMVNLEPETLFDTGLYADDSLTTLAPGVMPYSPQFWLWSDTAGKARYIWLPPGTQIDTSDMDHWKYPVGTKLWKQFSRGDLVVETRLLWKQSEDFNGWFMAAYEWNADGTWATRVRLSGHQNVLGTTHDIPSQQQCAECHFGQPDRVLGFTAIQLSHDASDTTLTDLIDAGLLTNPPAGFFDVPGNATERAALGYMHANCGHCHNPTPGAAGNDRNDMTLFLNVADLGSVEATESYVTAVNVDLDQDLSDLFPGLDGGVDGGAFPLAKRVVPGDPGLSAVYLRMDSRQEGVAMPPTGTEIVDPDGLQIVSDWINSLQ